MPSRARGAANLSVLLVAGLAGSLFGCASTNSVSSYKMVPAADFSVAAGATLAEGLDAPYPGQTFEDWTTAWARGPVSSIITASEFDRYEGLDTTTERVEFIRLFWHRRDPEPAEPYNEALQEFRRRVAVANELFASDDGPGWLTPFGRTLLTLGFPTIVRVGDKDGPRATTRQAALAEGGERVFWQYGLRAEDLGGTSLAAARSWPLRPVSQAGSAFYITFGYIRGGWSCACRSGWLADGVGAGWGDVMWGGNGASGFTAANSGVPGTSAAAGETLSPIAGSGGVAGGWGGGGGRASRPVARFGADCYDLFASARDAMLLNAVYYP